MCKCRYENKCVKICPKPITDNGLTINMEFWKFTKPFLTNNGFLESKYITLKEKT